MPQVPIQDFFASSLGLAPGINGCGHSRKHIVWGSDTINLHESTGAAIKLN
jgi:hypothetical protein